MPHILLVDDDIDLTELLSAVLVFDGFDVHTVHNGQAALDELEKNQYDLILLDVMMPLLNGIETLKQIRRKYATPVLMLSARNEEIDKIIGLELGADDYLPKPFNDRELVARIKAILRRVSPNSVPFNLADTGSVSLDNEDKYHFVFEGIEIYPGRQQAIFENNDLQLTSSEFSLFLMLIRNAGQIITRERLSAEIFHKRLNPFDRAIDMHMSNLRKKLPERNNGLAWFKTLRGRGYLLLTK